MAEAYEFSAELWLYNDGSWHFVTLPEDLSDEIDERHGGEAGGFGSIRVEVTIGSTKWRTSLFPSKTKAAYVLPVKASVRMAEGLDAGTRVAIVVRVVDANG